MKGGGTFWHKTKAWKLKHQWYAFFWPGNEPLTLLLGVKIGTTSLSSILFVDTRSLKNIYAFTNMYAL